MTPSERPLIVAELCQNHRGDRSVLLDLVAAAAEAGADYVKIQALYSRDLVFRDRFEPGPDPDREILLRPHQAEVDRLAKLDLTPDDELEFVAACRRAGVRSMITVFTRAEVPRLVRYGFDAVKIASYDCASYPLLREVARHWSRMFVSTGSMFDHEVERAARVLAGCEFSLLHCVTSYPSQLADSRLGRMAWLRRFTPDAGFSDHSRYPEDGILASAAALALGATVIERHFTILPADQTRDGPVSVDPGGLRALRAAADTPAPELAARLNDEVPSWRGWTGPSNGPSADELRNRDFYQGRVASRVNGRIVWNWEDIDLSTVAALPALGEKAPG